MSNIERIIAVGTGAHLCAIRYSDQAYESPSEHELSRLFRQWEDPEYLEDYYERHKDDFRSGFFGKLDFIDFLDLTERESIQLQRNLVTASNAASPVLLSRLFKPLHNDQTERDKYQQLKAKGLHPRTWLRLYALRTLDDAYIITGGAIKLNHRMDDRPHLVRELDKLNAVRKTLSAYIRKDEFYILYGLLD